MNEDYNQKKPINSILMGWLEPPVVVAAIMLLCVLFAGYFVLGLDI